MKKQGLEPLAFDLFALTAGILYFTGGYFLLNDQLQLLINQKPWIHRTVLSLMAVTAAAWFFIRENQVNSGKTGSGIIVAACKNLNLTERGVLWLLFLLTTLLWGISSSIRHEAFQTSFDMAIFTQAIWNTAQGDWFYSSIKGGVNLMSDHFSPVLALLAIPYRFFPSPHLILWIQALAAASALIPLHAIAKRKLSDQRLIFVVLMAYFFYLPIRNAVRFDFHPEVLSVPLFLWAFYFLETKKFFASSLCLMLALTTKEGGGIVAAGFGFYALIKPKETGYGLFWLCFGIIYFALITQWVIPDIFKADYFYLASNYLAWKDRGGFPALMQHLFNFSTLVYVIKVFAPLCFFSFMDFSLILTFPALAQNLLARNEMARSIFFQYTTFLTPFVFISAIQGAAKLKHPKGVATALLISSLLMGGVAEPYVIQTTLSHTSSAFTQIKKSLQAIPENASVRTHEFLAAHAANRKELHIYENTHPNEGGSDKALNAEYVILAKYLSGNTWEEIAQQLMAAGYTIDHNHPEFRVYRKKQIFSTR